MITACFTLTIIVHVKLWLELIPKNNNLPEKFPVWSLDQSDNVSNVDVFL